MVCVHALKEVNGAGVHLGERALRFSLDQKVSGDGHVGVCVACVSLPK